MLLILPFQIKDTQLINYRPTLINLQIEDDFSKAMMKMFPYGKVSRPVMTK
jgi:hypothetical protein